MKLPRQLITRVENRKLKGCDGIKIINDLKWLRELRLVGIQYSES